MLKRDLKAEATKTRRLNLYPNTVLKPLGFHHWILTLLCLSNSGELNRELKPSAASFVWEMTRVDSSSKWLPGLGFEAPEVVVLLSKDEGGGDTTEDALLLLLLELPKRETKSQL